MCGMILDALFPRLRFSLRGFDDIDVVRFLWLFLMLVGYRLLDFDLIFVMFG